MRRDLAELAENWRRARGGETVVWPGGADLAPDTLYERVRTGAWPEDPVPASRPADA